MVSQDGIEPSTRRLRVNSGRYAARLNYVGWDSKAPDKT